jgi:hypothetical protein
MGTTQRRTGRRWVKWAALGVALAAVGVTAVKLWPNDERRVRRTVDLMRRAAEDLSPEGMLKFVAPEYRDPLLGVGKDDLRLFLYKLFMEFESLEAFYVIDRLDIADGHATVELMARAVVQLKDSAQREELFGSTSEAAFTLRFEKRDGKWLLVEAERPKIRFE